MRVPKPSQSDFEVGKRVRWLPPQAYGDARHPDCKNGRVIASIPSLATVLVRFENGKTEECEPGDLVWTP